MLGGDAGWTAKTKYVNDSDRTLKGATNRIWACRLTVHLHHNPVKYKSMEKLFAALVQNTIPQLLELFKSHGPIP